MAKLYILLIVQIAFLLNTSIGLVWSTGSKHKLSGVLMNVESFKPFAIKKLPPEVDALGYRDSELPHAHVSDLNGDGVPDYLIAAHSNLCGTGGCPYLLVDGKSRRAIGEFFGTVALLNQKIKGYPVIQAISKRDIAAVTVSTYVFDGKGDRLVSSSLLEERGIAQWKETFGQEKQP